MPFICGLGFHDWNRAYLSIDSCNIDDKCSRCGVLKGQVVVIHEWEWIERNPCLTQQVCKRCGTIGEINEKEHPWKEIYKSNSYEIQKICERCGVIKTRVSEFSTFIGQEEIKLRLFTLVAAARKKGELLPHLLLCGQPGMGKVTLAKIIAAEMVADIIIDSRPFTTIIDSPPFGIKKVGDLAAILTNMHSGSFLIIEQIEAMHKHILERLVPAIVDFSIDITIGKGPSARSIHLKLPVFTVIGTTSKPTRVDEQLANLMFMFDFTPYDLVEIGEIISLSARQQQIDIELEAINLMAEHSNGCPAEALLVLKKVQKYAIAYEDGHITTTIARDALGIFGSKGNPPILERQLISDDVKMFVWKRDGGHCVKCGSQNNLEYDHIIPVSKGGSNTARNIRLLCEKCNRSKGPNIA